ncbi:MAG: DUF1566 domain-containing protein [Campylobacterales bacterium]|nr:DUF1566 domain-containing protein [Campylobacterales bacterium]
MRNKIVTALAAVGMMVSVAGAGVVSKNGIAKDSVTGLMWQDEPYTEAEKQHYKENTNNRKAGSWEYAKGYCQNLSLGGKKDWRLPNIYELSTITDNTKSEKPYIIDGFENTASGYYWSSTTYVAGTTYAWNVNFDGGFVLDVGKTYSYYVRCVRGKHLNFDNLSLLKKQGKLKVSQENIDKISPSTEAKRKKEAEKEKQSARQQSSSSATSQYVSWQIRWRNKDYRQSDPESSTETIMITCSNGTESAVTYFYNSTRNYKPYYTRGNYNFSSLEEAANHICGNR